jgi:hypothetical protein
MRRFVHTLREKPLEVRKQILMMVSIAVTALIFVVWVATLQYRFNADARHKIQSDWAPIAHLKESITNSIPSKK